MNGQLSEVTPPAAVAALVHEVRVLGKALEIALSEVVTQASASYCDNDCPVGTPKCDTDGGGCRVLLREWAIREARAALNLPPKEADRGK